MTVTLSGSTAISGILKYQYSVDGGQTWQDLAATEETPATATMPYTARKAQLTLSESGTYQFRAVSNAGSVSAQTAVTVRIDKELPRFSLQSEQDQYRISAIVNVLVQPTPSGTARVEVSKDGGSWIDITSTGDDGLYRYQVTENGTCTFRVTSGAGLSQKMSIRYAKLDAEKPTLTLDTGSYTEGAWATGDVTFTAEASQNIAPVTIQYQTGDGSWQDLTTGAEGAGSVTGSLVVNTDTPATTYTFRAVGASGVVSDEQSVTLKRDAASPEGTVTIGEDTFKKLIHDITFGLFFNKNVDVTFAATDETSGVASLEYIRSETLLTEDELKASTAWTPYTAPLAETVQDGQRFVYYGKATDQAGNVTVFGADGVIFDTAAPAITGVTDGATYYTTQTVTVADVNPDTLTCNGQPVSLPATLPGNTSATYVLTATDKAGNASTVTVTMKPIADLTAPVEGLTTANVTSQNIPALEQVQIDVSRVLNNDAMTGDERALLESIQTDLARMVEQVENARQAAHTQAIEQTQSVTADTVQQTDRASLETARDDLNTALTDYSGNYTAEETAQLEAAQQRVSAALASLDNVQAVQDAVDALPDTLEPDELDIIRKVEDAQAQYRQLTAHEQELLGTAAPEKLAALLANASAYKILSGDASTWTLGGSDGLTITANGAPQRLTGLLADGQTLTEGNYTVRSGSTVVTLSPGYLNSLAVGAHTLTFVYENGQTTATFTVAAAPAPGGSDNTGADSSASGTGTSGGSASSKPVSSASSDASDVSGSSVSGSSGASQSEASSDASSGASSAPANSETGADAAQTGSVPVVWIGLLALIVLVLAVLLWLKRRRS